MKTTSQVKKKKKKKTLIQKILGNIHSLTFSILSRYKDLLNKLPFNLNIREQLRILYILETYFFGMIYFMHICGFGTHPGT